MQPVITRSIKKTCRSIYLIKDRYFFSRLYYVQAAPLVSFVLVAFRVLQRWIIEFRVARGENVFDPAHPERNTPESFIQANAESHNESALESGIDNRINTIKNSNEEEH